MSVDFFNYRCIFVMCCPNDLDKTSDKHQYQFTFNKYCQKMRKSVKTTSKRFRDYNSGRVPVVISGLIAASFCVASGAASVYAGYHKPSVTLNGFVVPYFDRGVAERVLTECLGDGYRVVYSYDDCALMVIDSGNSLVRRCEGVMFGSELLFQVVGFEWEVCFSSGNKGY